MSATQRIREALKTRHNSPSISEGYVTGNDFRADTTSTQLPVITVTLRSINVPEDVASLLPGTTQIQEIFELIYRQRVFQSADEVEARLTQILAADITWLRNRGVVGVGTIRFGSAEAEFVPGKEQEKKRKPSPSFMEIRLNGTAQWSSDLAEFMKRGDELDFTPTAIITHEDIENRYPLNYQE